MMKSKRCRACDRKLSGQRLRPYHGHANSPETIARMRVAAARRLADPEYLDKFRSGIARRTADPSWRASAHFQKGAAHPRYTGGMRHERTREMARYPYKVWRSQVFGRDGYACRDCKVRGGSLVAHHVEEWSKAPDLRYEVSNGLTLCETCHDLRHGKVRRPKQYACKVCDQPKRDNRSLVCRGCSNRITGARRKLQAQQEASA